jgi:CRISPR-associated protein Cas5h
MTNNQCVIFRYKGKYAHFLKAEANASAPSYPFPTRTILIGLLGAVMGFKKDLPQVVLKDANIAVSGKAELTHWHTANLRKDPPAQLPYTINKKDKGTSKAQRNTIIVQEWLFQPQFIVYAQVPDQYHKELRDRIRDREWYFTPCLGLSEMTAELEFIDCVTTVQLPQGEYEVATITRQEKVNLDMQKILASDTVIKSIRMPCNVTENRMFVHANYLYEVNGKTLPVNTSYALKAGNQIIQWL